MELFTRNLDPEWDTRVDLSVEKTNGISSYVDDAETFKIILIDSGTLTVSDGETQIVLIAPALIAVTNKEKLTYQGDSKLKTTTVFFKPTVIREDFDVDRLLSGIFEETYGQTLYQDYVLLRSFAAIKNPLNRVIRLGPVSYRQIMKMIQQMDYELRVQHDGYWRCRSRSYFVELLSHCVYHCAEPSYLDSSKVTQAFSEDSNIVEVIRYLNDHIEDEISLGDITREFGMNRKQLNAMFVQETSVTCMNYLIDMRIQLAKVILSETELPIGEISARVGYVDMNYFTRLFKKRVGVTPSQFRKNPELAIEEG